MVCFSVGSWSHCGNQTASRQLHQIESMSLKVACDLHGSLGHEVEKDPDRSATATALLMSFTSQPMPKFSQLQQTGVEARGCVGLEEGARDEQKEGFVGSPCACGAIHSGE